MKLRTLRGKLSKLVFTVIILDIVVFAATLIFSHNHTLTENLYARGVYPIIVAITSFFSDLFPFSIQELLIMALFLAALFLFGRGIWRLATKKSNIKKSTICFFKILFLSLSLLYILFYFSWGFNYFRVRLTEQPAFSKKNINKKKFSRLLRYTITQANKLANKKQPKWKTTNKEIEHNLTILLKKYGNKRIYSGRRVKRFLSGYLTLGGFSGVCLPLLHEAHIARDLFDFEIPFVAAHEKTHLKGYAIEAEANYFAYLVCLNSSTPAVRYSAHFSLLRYLLHSIPQNKRKQYWKKLSPAVKKHFAKIAERHKKRSKTFQKFARSLYNKYLKTQRIKDGIANYRKFVKLILGYTPPHNSIRNKTFPKQLM